MLVCLGAALVMMTSEYMYFQFQSGDPGRLGAQVISGIGFLGAGSIIISGNTKIRGLTTAAGLWVSACIGIAIGIGFYLGGVISTIAVYVIMSKLRKLEDRLAFNHNITIKLLIKFRDFEVIPVLKKAVEMTGLEIQDLQIDSKEEENHCNLVIKMKPNHKIKIEDMIAYLEHIEGIDEMEQVL